jgi:hypothetical protein
LPPALRGAAQPVTAPTVIKPAACNIPRLLILVILSPQSTGVISRYGKSWLSVRFGDSAKLPYTKYIQVDMRKILGRLNKSDFAYTLSACVN